MSGDILIRGGLVIDGSGRPGEFGDVAVSGGRIAAVGRSLPNGSAKVIDAEGLAVTPGFIDIKTHSDFTLPINPKAESKVRQGVTTEIIGHCGFSVAPVLPGKLELIRDYLSASAPWLPFREMRFPEYLDTFPATAVNAGMLVGHHTLRLNVMGMAARTPTGSELAQMTALLEEALDAGALGLSTGLFTPPSSYADRAEIVALCAVLKRHNAAYFTHIRDESNRVVESVEEAIDIARTCGVHVEIVHLKCSGLDNWGKAAPILAMIEAARAEGLAIDCDAYPYAAGSNPLKNLLPQWVQSGGLGSDAGAPRAVRNTRARPRRDRARRAQQLGPHPVLGLRADLDLAASAATRWRDHRRDRGGARLPIRSTALCDYLIEDKGATRVLITSIAEEDIREILRSPSALVGSDGNCVADYGIVAQGMPHPRFYGTFPRIIGHYVHEQRLLPLEQAVHKMTGATAAALRLRDRGLIKEGYRADI